MPKWPSRPCYNPLVIKKVLLLLILALAYLSWHSYGYLWHSWRNLPPSTQVISDPVGLAQPDTESSSALAYLHARDGYTISYFAQDVPGARSLAIGNNGIVYVGTRSQGVVYALEDQDDDGIGDTRYVVASGLNNPNGVVYHDGALYVAEISRIIRFDNIDTSYNQKPSYSVVYDRLPSDTHHGWRYLALGPDNKLYIGIGAPCNTCEVSDPYGTIARLDLDGSDFEVIARGIRNTVGFDWNPEDESLWFTDNGSDNMGDDLPRDELNQLRTEGEHFGYPYCHEGSILDPKFGLSKDCNDYAPPALPLSPHAAALGMKFVGGQALIAEHGSWNRKTPIGYRIMSVDIENGVASNYQVLVDGWLADDGTVLGRPVDILIQADGVILVSDDFAGVIYRLQRSP